MAFWVWVAVQVALTIAASLLAQRAKIPKSSPASQEPPTADIDRPIPIVWGTCKVRPNVVYFGFPQQFEFTKDGSFAGYTYHAELALGICWGPIDALQDILFDDTRSLRRIQDGGILTPVSPALPRYLPTTPAKEDLTLDAQSLFGGAGGNKEGGIAGIMGMYYGRDDQDVDVILEARNLDMDDPIYLQSGQSAWPRLAYGFFYTNGPFTPGGPPRGFYFGTSPTAKSVHYVVQRFPSAANGIYTAVIPSSDYEEGYDSANPAEMVYEILTDDWWGLNIDAAKIDVTSFMAAAETLFAEGFGLSMQVTDAHPSDETIADILRYIDGVVYTDPRTGLIKLDLIRADFDVDDIPKVTPSNSIDLEFFRPHYRTLATMVRGKFTRIESRNFIEDIAQWTNQANREITGEERIETIDLASITDPVLASAVTFREAKQLTLPFARGTFKCDRAAFDFVKGSPFSLTWPEEEIGPVVCRVTAVDRGELENGQVSVSFVEDVFFLEADGLTAATAGGGGAAPPESETSVGVDEIFIDGGTP